MTASPEKLLFVALCVLCLLPVWWVPYFPSQDGGSHVETASVLLRYGDPSLPVFARHYDLNFRHGENWLVTLLLAGLMRVTSPAVAEKLVVTACVLLFAGSLRFALSRVRAGSGWLALTGLPLVYNFPLHMGFYNFCLSLAVFLVVIGYFLSHHPMRSMRSALVLGALLLFLYLCHPVSLLMAVASIAIFLIWPIPTPPWKQPKILLRTAAAVLPTAALLAAFMLRRGTGGPRLVWRADALRLDDFLILRSFVSSEVGFCAALGAILAALIVARMLRGQRERKAPSRDALLGATLLLFVIYLLAPDRAAGGTMIKTRITIYPLLALLLWLAAVPYPRRLRSTLMAAATLVLAGQVGFYANRYRLANERLTVYYQAQDRIEAGSTILPLCFDSWGMSPPLVSRHVQPYLHAAGRLSATRKALTLLNNPGNTDYYPVILRADNNPYRFITPAEKNYHLEPPIDFLSYPARTGSSVDYVLVWGLQAFHLRSPSVMRIFEQLQAGYEEIHTSEDGYMQLFRAKGGNS